MDVFVQEEVIRRMVWQALEHWILILLNELDMLWGKDFQTVLRGALGAPRVIYRAPPRFRKMKKISTQH